MTAAAPPGTAPTAGTLAGGPARRAVGPISATCSLTTARVGSAVRSGGLAFALAGPAIFFLCFHVPLHHRFEAGGGVYAQYLAPLILLQAGIFTAMSQAVVAGEDVSTGMRDRLLSMPVPRSAPMLSRMAWVVLRLLVTVASGVTTAALLGFRFHGGAGHTAGFVLLVVAFGLALSLMTDALGSVVRDPLAAATILNVPQLLLVMASTGLVPVEGFPDWAQPVVRNQPVSVFADALRALSEGRAPEWTAVTAWTLGLLAVGVLAETAAARRGTRR